MKRVDPHLQAFEERVALKYRLYNGLFLALPFEDLADTGVQLPLFAGACREQLKAGKSPAEIVERFFKERPAAGSPRPGRGRSAKQDHAGRLRVLFKFLQLVERQVVLFDALEDAAFPFLNDLEGPGSLAHLLARAQDAHARERLADALAGYRVRIVLTAHPTQFYPDSILGILTDLSAAIEDDRLAEINELLLQMGKTRFQNRQRPTPLEEARSLIWYLEHIFYPTLPDVQARLAAALPEGMQDPFALEPKVELGFWPGGDRDGNPYVTSDVTFQVARALKASVIALYLRDLEALANRLTFDGIIQPLQDIRDRLQAAAAPQAGKPPRLPFMAAVDPGETPRKPPRPYAAAEEMLADLRALRAELADKHGGLFMDRLDGFIHKVRMFGFHFAGLDLRQDSRVHGSVLEEVFARMAEYAHYSEASEDGKAALLGRFIAGPDPKAAFAAGELGPLAADTLGSLAAARAIQKANGPRGMHRYVISNTRSARNVLEVLALARLAGWKAGGIDLDIVPLFETIEDLEHAEGIMRSLYADDAYAAHLRRRGGKAGPRQTIMLGFSDGTKDGGYLTANWAIHKAKRDLTRVSREAGVDVVFFDGRGGPPARGGGNTHKFYRSLGADIEHREIQLTIQGQTISSNFGTPDAARYNIEQLFTAGLEDKLSPPPRAGEAGPPPDLAPEDIRVLETLSAESRAAYRRFKEHPLFLPYLEEMTPLGYYNLLNIASRPTRRKSASALRFEDLRAIPFVGAWSQMKQNIPGFYGVGEALEKLIARGKRKKLEELYRSSLFFRTLVENAMMSLTKSYFPLTQYLGKDRKYGRFWKRIYKEATLAKDLLKEITGQQKLMENNPSIRASIRIREELILPLLVIQQYAMGVVKAARKDPGRFPRDAEEAYVKMVVKAMAANINAARNSA